MIKLTEAEKKALKAALARRLSAENARLEADIADVENKLFRSERKLALAVKALSKIKSCEITSGYTSGCSGCFQEASEALTKISSTEIK